MRQGQEEGDCCFGVCRGMPEEGLMFTYRLMPLMRQGQEEGAKPEEGLMFNLPPDAPHANRDRRRRIAVLGCVGVCQRENDDG